MDWQELALTAARGVLVYVAMLVVIRILVQLEGEEALRYELKFHREWKIGRTGLWSDGRFGRR